MARTAEEITNLPIASKTKITSSNARQEHERIAKWIDEDKKLKQGKESETIMNANERRIDGKGYFGYLSP